MWNMYGWTGAGCSSPAAEEAAQRTDDVFQIIQEETSQHEGVLSLIAADVNGSTKDFPTLVNLEHTEQWSDLGSMASRWGGIDNQMTCKAGLLAKETRIDRIFVNTLLLPAVRGFQVDVCDEYSTHQPLQLRLEAGALESNVDKHRKTASAAAYFEKRIAEDLAKHPEQNPNDVRQMVLGQLHSVMEHEVSIRTGKLAAASGRGDTTAMWRIISSEAEKAFADFST